MCSVAAPNDFLPVAQEQPMLPTKADASCVTIEDLNSQWLFDFINPFTSFVEDTLQACDSNTVANVKSTCILWTSLLSTPDISSGSSSPRSDVRPPIPLRMTTVDSLAFPPSTFVEERKLPKEAGIEVRPLKTRAAVEKEVPFANECNAPTPLASNRLQLSPAPVSMVENVGSTIGKKQTMSDGTKKMLRSKSIKKVLSKKKSKK